MNDLLGVFDIGGTGYRLASGLENGGIYNLCVGETCSKYEEGYSRLVLDLEKSGAGRKFTKIGGCVAGIIDQKRGIIVSSPNLPDWEGKPLGPDLEKHFGCPVFLENDAAAEGLGEAVFGAGKDFNAVGFFTVGTGVGGALIKNSQIDIRAEVGWQIIYHEGETGYLEAMAGGRAIEKIYGMKPKEITDPKVWEKETRLLAIGINNAMVLWNPEIIVLGGSIFKSIDLEFLKQILKEQNVRFPNLPQIVKGTLGQEAGLWGCLKLLNDVTNGA